MKNTQIRHQHLCLRSWWHPVSWYLWRAIDPCILCWLGTSHEPTICPSCHTHWRQHWRQHLTCEVQRVFLIHRQSLSTCWYVISDKRTIYFARLSCWIVAAVATDFERRCRWAVKKYRTQNDSCWNNYEWFLCYKNRRYENFCSFFGYGKLV